MSAPRVFRNGNSNARNIYEVIDGIIDEHRGVMFTEEDGVFMVNAANHYAAQRALRPVTTAGSDNPRVAERLVRRARAVEMAEQLGRSVACQRPLYASHRKCLGLKATMNNGMGCLCECHDGEPEAGQAVEVGA